MKIACSTGIRTKRKLKEALKEIKSLGFEAVDLFVFENWAHLNPSDIAKNPEKYAAKIKELLAQTELKLIAINSAPPNPINTQNHAIHEGNLKVMAGVFQFAQLLGVPVVTVGSGSEHPQFGLEKSTQNAIANLKDHTTLAAQYNTQLGIETHAGSLAEHPLNATRFIQEVPGLKITYDPSHYIMSYIELPTSEPLMDHIVHCHLRDARRGCFQEAMGKGLLDFNWVLTKLKQHNYQGYIAIEYIEDNAIEDSYNVIEQVIKLRDYLSSHI